MPLLKRRSAIGEAFTSIWHIRVPDYVVALEHHPAAEACYALTGGGQLVAIDIAESNVRWIRVAHAEGANHLALMEGADVLATAGQDCTVRTWSASDGRALGVLRVGTAWPERILAAKGARRFLVGAGKRLLAINESAELEAELGSHQASIADMEWHPYKSQFITASYGEVKLWHAERLDEIECLPWKGSILKVAMSPNGRILATGNQDATVHFWHLQNSKDSQMWGYPRKVRELSWSKDSRYLATGGGANVTVWDFSGKGPEGSTPIELTTLGSPITILSYEQEGNFLAGGTEHGHVFVWNPLKRDNVIALEMVTGAVSCLQWLPQKQGLLVASAEGDIRHLKLAR